MLIDVRFGDPWQQINEELAEYFAIGQEQRVIGFQHVSHALREIATGLPQLFSHKKSMAYFTDQGPYFENIAIEMSRNGMGVERLTLKDSFEDAKMQLELVEDDLLFVLISEDDPVTGEIHDISEWVRFFTEKKIFTVRVSHAAHFYRKELLSKESSPFDLRVFSFGGHGSLGVLGQRSRSLPTMAGNLKWPENFAEEIAKRCSLANAVNKDVVSEFEGKQLSQCRPYFGAKNTRIWDRAVVFWEDMDGFLFIHYLARLLRKKLLPPGTENELETTSLCRWETLSRFAWLQQRGLDAQQVRGLVVVSLEVLMAPDFEAYWQQAREKCLQVQQLPEKWSSEKKAL